MDSATLQEIHTLFHSLQSPHGGDRDLITADLDVINNFRNVSFIVDRRTGLAFLFFHRRDKGVNILDTDILKKCGKVSCCLVCGL